MVQNWENFMDPRGGYYDTDIISGTSSIVAGLAIDLLARPAMTYSEKQTLKMSRENILGKGKTRVKKASKVLDPNRIYGTSRFGILGGPTRQRVREIGKEYTKRSQAASKNIKSNFASAKGLLKGLSWTLFATFIADTAESTFLPGTTGSAKKSDQMAFGMSGPTDSEGAYTQRQRALMAIHDSQLGIRSVIGNEAGHFHR